MPDSKNENYVVLWYKESHVPACTFTLDFQSTDKKVELADMISVICTLVKFSFWLFQS